MADYSGSISSGGTAQTAAAGDANRVAIVIANVSDTDIWYAFGVTAVADSPSFPLLAGETVMFGAEWRTLITQPLSVIGATTGKKFTIFDAKG